VSGSGISWVICPSAPCPRHITTPASHHSVFYRPDALPAANQQHQSTEGMCDPSLTCTISEHRRDESIIKRYTDVLFTLNFTLFGCLHRLQVTVGVRVCIDI